MRQVFALALAVLTLNSHSWAQEHTEHTNTSGTANSAPKVYLDKSPKVVEYQLKRLSNSQLLSIEVATNHTKYAPVFSAIAVRPGMSAEQRKSAIESLATIAKQSFVETVLERLRSLSSTDRSQQSVANELTLQLLQSSLNETDVPALTNATTDSNSLAARAAMAGLISMGKQSEAQRIAETTDAARVNLLGAVPLVTNVTQRTQLRPFVLASLDPKWNIDVRREATKTLPSLSDEENESFAVLAEQLREPELEETAVQSLLKISPATVTANSAKQVAETLVARAEATPASERSSNRFVDAAQLVERLLPRLAEADSRAMRTRMQAIAVRVIRIKSVAEEMRYDLKYFVAAAGKPIQVILQNDDLMPHNLVVVKPGSLKEVALQAATMAPDALTAGKQYVPAVEQVLFATKMIQAGKQERLTFDAPAVPGEYPFVCTYPNHWMRMYGVMVVVEDLDAFLQSPTEPKDPIGNNRSFVQNWKLSDFDGKLEAGLLGRTAEIGSKIFAEATCLQCHVVENKGGRVGPELDGVFKRHKDDAVAVLREIIDPSHKIDPKYASHSVLTLDGQVYSGVVVAETEKTISLVNNPDQLKPTVITRTEIDEMVQSPKSIMPAALLDQFTQDEIFELVAYIKSVNENAK